VKIKAVFLVCACVMLVRLSALCWWRTGRLNPCVVVVMLVVAYRGTWDFAHWCSHKGRKQCGARDQLQQGLAVAGMSWTLRCVFVVVLILQ